MSATFILSLDCEGKWGMADHIGPYHDHHLTTDKLREAYSALTALFARYDVRATFAFVMAFLLSPAEQEAVGYLFPDHPEGRAWLASFRAAQARGELSGWTLPEALDIVRDDCRHEIASHGFSHLPLDQGTPRELVDAEFAACGHVARMRGLALETLVYPRNQVGHVDLLAGHGLRGYRQRLNRGGGPLAKAAALASELNVFERPQPDTLPASDQPAAIPSGHFFNWRVGARRVVPRWTTEMRWRRMLEAANDGEVVHLWLHPHNIITGPETLPLLERVLRDVARLRDAGRLEIATQATYCRALAARN